MQDDGGSSSLDPRSRAPWRTAQLAVAALGLAILVALFLRPRIGLHAFWNVLVPIAPALVALAPGLWRNVCPLASVSLLPRQLSLSARRRITEGTGGWMSIVGLALLLGIVPLRHVSLNTDAGGTALTLCALASTALVCGVLFESKSGWCSGICPVHPVERLYGCASRLSLFNARCDRCLRCVEPCPDTTMGWDDPSALPRVKRVATVAMVGGFPGFVWGWFQVSDSVGWSGLPVAYGYPLASALVTLSIVWFLQAVHPGGSWMWIHRTSAGAAIACYYWYRVPMLFGWGAFPGDGMLIDLRLSLPSWFPMVSKVTTTAFWVGWFLLRREPRRPWLLRPPFAEGVGPDPWAGSSSLRPCAAARETTLHSGRERHMHRTSSP